MSVRSGHSNSIAVAAGKVVSSFGGLKQRSDRLTNLSATTCALLCTLLLTCGTAAADTPAEREQQRIETIDRIAPSVVCVMPPGGQGGGSGVLISADGYAISNYHVTSGSGDFMKCGLNDGRLYDAVIVGIDPTGDVALIRLLGRDDFPYCTPGDSDQVKVGDEVLALGNPFLLASDFTPTVTYGIVSGIQRYQYPADTFLEYSDCIQIDASINPGNSGGPLFDIEGRWIGINGRASFEKRGRINSGAAYAISVRQVLLFVDHLKSGRIVDHGRTDFTVGTYDGVVEVEQVSELSEAWRRGLRVGDEVLSFGGRALTSANDFKNIMGIFPEESRVPLTFRNDDGVQKITVRLARLHDFEAAPKLPEERQPEPKPQNPDDPDPEDPDDKPHGHPGTDGDEPKPPDEYVHLFEKKKGFANYYFNRQNTERFLKPLQTLLSASSPVVESTWILKASAQTDAGEHVGEISVGSRGAGLDLAGLAPQLQPADNQKPANESREFYGLLSGLLQWYRLFQNDTTLFADVTYFGSERLLPSGKHVHIVKIQDAAVTSRWYFSEESPLPVGVDVHVSAGADEGRLRFEEWNTDGEFPVPGRIGVVDAHTEAIRWIQIDSMQVKGKVAVQRYHPMMQLAVYRPDAFVGTPSAIRSSQQVVVKLFGAGVGTLDSYGSGVLVSEQGHVVTVWNHLVNSGYLTAVVSDGRRFPVTVIGTSLEHDLAVLKLDTDNDVETFPSLKTSEFSEATPGDPVLAFSNVFHVATGNEPVSVVHGVMAVETVLDAGFGRWTFPVKTPVYVLDAITNNSGAAGGLLTNADGQPLGLLGREIRHRDTDMWVNYAIPWKTLQPAITAILEGRRITSAASTEDGRTMISDRRLTSEFGLTLLPGFLPKTPAYVDRVVPGSIADKAGLQRSDLVLMVNDDVIQSVDDLRTVLGKFRKGQAVSITVNRRDRLETVSLRVP